MFLGHLAVGLAAKGAARKPSLAACLAAAQWPDLVWPIFLWLDLESVAIAPGWTRVTPLYFASYPLSHSLLADVGWAFLFAGLYFYRRRDGLGALSLWACVLSHWLLDFVSHSPDLPLYPGGPRLGLGLWNYVAATMLVEGALIAVGILIYSTVTRARDRKGIYIWWSFVAVTLTLYVANIFGPPPPGISALEAGAFLNWLVVPWGMWIDRHREVLA
jgi:hypothetical protein